MILPKESEEGIRLLPERHVLSDKILKKTQENNNKKIAYEVIIIYLLHMPSYFGGDLLNIPKYHFDFYNYLLLILGHQLPDN